MAVGDRGYSIQDAGASPGAPFRESVQGSVYGRSVDPDCYGYLVGVHPRPRKTKRLREEEYLRLMEAAGFRDVHVVQKSRFEIEETGIDAYARSIAGNFDVPPEAVREAARSVLSVQVFGRKSA